MKSYSRQAIILGLALTLIVMIASLLGWLDQFERESLDFRATYTWRTPRPMTSDICIAAIDSGALESIGRWPWARGMIGGAIREMRDAGAKVIALDLLLGELQEPVPRAVDPAVLLLRSMNPYDFDAVISSEVIARMGREDSFRSLEDIYRLIKDDSDRLIKEDSDGILAEAMQAAPGSPGRCVVSVAPPEGEELHATWESPLGKLELVQLMEVLKQDIQISADKAIEKAELRGERKRHFKDAELAFKARAIREKLKDLVTSLPAHELSMERLKSSLTPSTSTMTGKFKELKHIERAWDEYEAWQHLRPLLTRTNVPLQQRFIPPLARLCATASGVGYVVREEDDDGEIRMTTPLRPVPTGLIAPLGVAAAASFLDIRPSDIEVVGSHYRIGERIIPLTNGRMWIAWPRMIDRADEHEGILRQTPADPAAHAFFSLGQPVSLAEQRERQLLNERDYIQLTAYFARTDLPGAKLGDLTTEIRDAARDEVNFILKDGESTEGLSDAEMDEILSALRWREHDLHVYEGQTIIDQAHDELREKVDGKLVFVGWTATGAAADFVPTPLDTTTPGVIVHAAVADMVLTGRSVTFIAPWLNVALTALIGIMCTLAAAKLTPARSMIIVIILLGTYYFVSGYVAFGQLDTAIGMVAPMSAGAAAWVGCTALEAVLFQRDRLRITRQFKSRVSSQLVDFLVENPGAVSVTGETREMTVMFADLAGFTSLSETLGGPATVATINRYLGALTEPLIKKGAYVNKFLGDGYMAFWSAFATDPTQATRAALAALEGITIVETLNNTIDIPGLPALRLRVGITTGRVVVGDCGAPPQLNDYTVIGDSVNLASRLESANKQFGTRILIDGRTRELLDPGVVLLRPIGRVTVFGQKKPVDIFEVLPSDASGEMIDLTAQAIDHFKAGELEQSATIWRRLIEEGQSRELALLYLESIRTSGDQFDGVLHLLEK